MVNEQDTVEEARAQTDFKDSNPEAQALGPRHRDAESHLSERMSYNHSLNESNSDNTSTDNVKNNTIAQTDSNNDKWQDGLRRDENDNV